MKAARHPWNRGVASFRAGLVPPKPNKFGEAHFDPFEFSRRLWNASTESTRSSPFLSDSKSPHRCSATLTTAELSTPWSNSELRTVQDAKFFGIETYSRFSLALLKRKALVGGCELFRMIWILPSGHLEMCTFAPSGNCLPLPLLMMGARKPYLPY